MANQERTHYQQALVTFTGNSTGTTGEPAAGHIPLAPPRIYETEPVFNFRVFCFTKKADSMLLLRTGARTISCLGLSKDLNGVKGLEPSDNSCKKKFLYQQSLLYQGRFQNRNKHGHCSSVAHCQSCMAEWSDKPIKP